MKPSREQIADEFKKIQNEICSGIELLDGKGKFSEDRWNREGGGGGISRVIAGGDLLEKGGVNFSEVHGIPPNVLKEEFKDATNFFATGVSIVLHPHNPLVPIIHMNIRYFEVDTGQCWFGGGIDVTPHYIVDEDARHFHEELKKVCDTYHTSYYPEFSKWADDYFFITHRNETRGVGGIFFDHQSPREGQDWSRLFEFVCALGRSFVALYTQQVTHRRNLPFTDQQKRWQLLRRGRYVEFNLVYDRGTRFGLLTGGRTESILMSLPETARWEYNFHPEKNSPEEQTLVRLSKGRYRA
ncbi:MAG: oxygen-dependent coproporphyrinogen oxidase [Flavobacteriales bacterium]